MKRHSKNLKQSIVSQLSQEVDPIGLRDLVDKLREGRSDRTVRRWLNKLVEEGVVEKSGIIRSASGGQLTYPLQIPRD